MSDFVKIAQQRTMDREYHEEVVTRSDIDAFKELSPVTLTQARQVNKDLHSVREQNLIIYAPNAITIAVGQTIRLTPMLHYKNYALQDKDVSAIASWTSSAPAKATVALCVITGVAAGTTNITASLDGLTSNVIVITVI